MRRFGINLAISMAALLLAIMAVFAAVGFACLSFYLYLVTVTTPSLAALGTVGGALLFALAVMAIAGLVWRRPRRRYDEDDILGGLSEALGLGKSLGAEGRGYLNSHLSKASIAAFGLGVAMGVSPRLRRLVKDLLLG